MRMGDPNYIMIKIEIFWYLVFGKVHGHGVKEV